MEVFISIELHLKKVGPYILCDAEHEASGADFRRAWRALLRCADSLDSLERRDGNWSCFGFGSPSSDLDSSLSPSTTSILLASGCSSTGFCFAVRPQPPSEELESSSLPSFLVSDTRMRVDRGFSAGGPYTYVVPDSPLVVEIRFLRCFFPSALR